MFMDKMVEEEILFVLCFGFEGKVLVREATPLLGTKCVVSLVSRHVLCEVVFLNITAKPVSVD